MTSIRFGVASRLVGGLIAITIFAIATSVLAIFGFSRFQDGFQAIAETEMPNLVNAAELVRQSESIVANAPALGVAHSQQVRKTVGYRMEDQVAQFEALATSLFEAGIDPGDLEQLREFKSDLVANLERIDGLVERRIDADLEADRAIRTLLDIAKRLRTTEVAVGPESVDTSSNVSLWKTNAHEVLSLMLASQSVLRPASLAQVRKASAAAFGRADAILKSLPGKVTAKVRPLHDEIRRLAVGEDSVFDARAKRIGLDRRVQGGLSRNKVISDQFIAVVSNMFFMIQDDIRKRVDRFNLLISNRSRILAAISVLCVIGAGTIFLYINGSVVRRLKLLQGSMSAHVAGRTVDIPTAGSDEIADMARSLEFFVDAIERREQALREKEAQLRLALDHMPGGMVLFDRDLNFVLFNSQYSQLFEYPDGLVRVGESIRDALRYRADRGDFGPGDKDDPIEQVLAKYRRGEAQSFERAIAGRGRTLQVNLGPTPEGGYVTIVTDITERKRAEEALQEANGIIKEQRDRMESELNVGHEIQMSMVPLEFPPFPDRDEFSVFAALEPAREVGGDFYDYYFIDEQRICFCIGDVSGKGVPAALFMAMAKTLIKSRAADDRSAASILTHVNDELKFDNNKCMFVTVFIAILNIRTGGLVYTNAGHNPPYIKRKDGTLQRMDQRHGPVIGAVEGMVYKEGRDTLEPGDLLLLYTDGVTEAMDVEDRLFSDDRLEQLLTSMDTDDVDKVVDDTVAAVKAFEGEAEQADDITVVAVAFHGSPEDASIAERRIVIKNHLPEIATVNEKFEAFAEEFDLPQPITMKFNLILDEVLNNVISYAYGDDGDHDIEVRLELGVERLIVAITDDGAPFNPLSVAAPRTDLALEDREVGGLGIHLVRNLVDEVSYQRRIDKNILTLKSRLQQKDGAA